MLKIRILAKKTNKKEKNKKKRKCYGNFAIKFSKKIVKNMKVYKNLDKAEEARYDKNTKLSNKEYTI